MVKKYKSIDSKEHPLVININKTTMDIILQQEKSDQLMALYLFYAYVSAWQDTKKIHATTGYTAKGLKWSIQKVQRVKKRLLELELIEDIVKRNNKHITGHYIRVKYLATHSKLRGVANWGDKCFNTGNNKCFDINRFTNVNEAVKKRPHANLLGNYKGFATRYGAKIQSKLNIQATVRNKGKVIHTPVSATTWAKEIVYILHNMRVHKEVFKAVMKWYFNEGIKERYTPRIYKAKDLVEKWPKIVDAMNRCQEEACSLPKRRKGADGEYGWYE